MKLAEGTAVKSADRVFDVLELLVDNGSPQSFVGISKALGIPKSSLFHLLRNLLARGYIEQDQDLGHYRPGPKLRELVARMSTPSMVEIVSPHVASASRQLNETACFFVRAGNQAQVICTSSGGQSLSYNMSTGDAAPLHAISAGRVILGTVPAHELNAYMADLKLEAYTRQTKVNPVDVRKAIEQAGETDFAYSFEEYTAGIVGMSQGVRHDGEVVGAITFAIPVARLDEERDREARRILQSSASAIEAALDRQSR